MKLPKISNLDLSTLCDHILKSLIPPVLVLWTFILFIQFIDALLHMDFTAYGIYSQVSLMLFGFTLLGNLAGRINIRLNNKEIKNLTQINVGFLLSTIGFLITYGSKNMLWINTDNVALSYIFIIFTMAFYTIGVMFMVAGIWGLYFLLRNIYRKL